MWDDTLFVITGEGRQTCSPARSQAKGEVQTVTRAQLCDLLPGDKEVSCHGRYSPREGYFTLQLLGGPAAVSITFDSKSADNTARISVKAAECSADGTKEGQGSREIACAVEAGRVVAEEDPAQDTIRWLDRMALKAILWAWPRVDVKLVNLDRSSLPDAVAESGTYCHDMISNCLYGAVVALRKREERSFRGAFRMCQLLLDNLEYQDTDCRPDPWVGKSRARP